MSDELIEYYDRELEYLRDAGAQFAKKHPKVAARLELEENKCEDPHVERLLEGFAFLAARVHLKLNDDFPELCEALLNVVYPGYVRPIPAMSIVEFELDPDQGKQMGRREVPAGTTLLTAPIRGAACKFRTCYDTVLWPLSITAAQFTTPDRLRPPVRVDRGESGAIRIEVRALPDVVLSSLGLDTLRLHLSGSATFLATLYEVMANNTARILLRDLAPDSRKPPIELPASSLVPVGFAEDEGMLPLAGRAFLGYRLLTEYFAFPERFFFFDVKGLAALRSAGFGNAFEIVVLTTPFELPERRQSLEAGVGAQTFKLGCSPTINLFEQTAEPILLTQKRYEYVVVPDHRRRTETEVFSVDAVRVQTRQSEDSLVFEPLYSLRHSTARSDRGRYYITRRRETPWRSDRSSEVLISFVDSAGQLKLPKSDTVTCQVTCFNSDLPSMLDLGQGGSDFSIEGGGPFKSIKALLKPTSVVQPFYGRELLSKLISQLSLNYLSIVEGGGDALREIMRLHNFTGAEPSQQQIAGIRNVTSSVAHARMVKGFGMGIARGRLVDIELEEERFAGTPMFLFASVIEHFLGMFASINSFSQLRVRSTRRKNYLREWAPRCGWKTIL